MRTRIIVGAALICLAGWLSLSCTDDDGPVRPAIETDQPLYIEEPILLDTTAWVESDGPIGGKVVFHFNSPGYGKTVHYNDICLRYGTWSPFDEEHLIYNFNREGWITLVPYYCFDGFLIEPGGGHSHLLSAKNLNAEEYLNESLQFWVHPCNTCDPFGSSTASGHRAMRVSLNEKYRPIPIPNDSQYTFVGMVFDGEYYLLLGGPYRLVKLNADGQFISEHQCLATRVTGLAFDGVDLWMSCADVQYLGDSTKIVRASIDGDILDEFYAPTPRPGGIGWAEGDLWLAEDDRSRTTFIFRIDPAASCSAGTAVVKDTIDIGQHGDALAWDGTHLLMSGDLLYKLTPQGRLVKAYVWTVGGQKGIAYHNGELHVLCSGPAGIYLTDQVIVPLRMR